MLLIVSVRLCLLLKTLEHRRDIVVALLVGGLSFVTRNLSIAVLVGICMDTVWTYLQKRQVVLKGAESDD
jgi:hypothetical protein